MSIKIPDTKLVGFMAGTLQYKSFSQTFSQSVRMVAVRVHAFDLTPRHSAPTDLQLPLRCA